jgi:hypothetical protein
MAPAEKNKQVTQVLYMPAVSVVVPESRSYQHGSLSYTYTQYVTEKPSIVSRIFGGLAGALAFVIGVFLFAIPVTVASLILLSSMTSAGTTITQTQEVPGVSRVAPTPDPGLNSIKPAR